MEKEKLDLEENEVVGIVETEYPIMTEEFKQIQKDDYDLFAEKQFSYGSDNIALGKNIEIKENNDRAVFGVIIRMNDKLYRLLNLTDKRKKETMSDESIDDTLMDLANYATIARLVRRGKWGR